MKLLREISIVMCLIVFTLAKPSILQAEVIDSTEDLKTSVADEKIEVIRDKRGLIFSSAYSVPVAYTSATYRAPVAYTYPYTYSTLYPYYKTSYNTPYYYI